MPISNIKTALLITVCSLLFACGEAPETPRVKITTLSPASQSTNSTFQNLQGKPIELSDYAGKKLLLNFWATWCAPCIRELPSLIRAADILGGEEFVVLLASDESLEDISEFVEENEFKGNFIKLNSFFASYGVEAVPSTVLFDVNGTVLNTWLGEYEWDSDEVLAELRESN